MLICSVFCGRVFPEVFGFLQDENRKERTKTEITLPDNKVSYRSVISPPAVHQTGRTIIFKFGISFIAMQCKNVNFIKKS